jgi:hypothetical protein
VRILVLGFNERARELIDTIKHFPGYGLHNQVFIYHVYVPRNSLSYGKELVVEIPDPHGDGYRTYKDGFQALDEYSTTISNYTPWLLEQAEAGAFTLVVDFLENSSEIDLLREQLSDALVSGSKWLSAVNRSNQELIESIRFSIDGGMPWTPVIYSSQFLANANDLWEAARLKMIENHRKNTLRDIERRKTLGSFDSPIYLPAIPKGDIHILFDDVVANSTDNVIEDPLLKDFFGWHHTQQMVAAAFLNPNIVIDTATYVRHHHGYIDAAPNYKYKLERIVSGTMTVHTDRGDMVISPDDLHNSYACSSETAPRHVSISEGAETLVFTYKESDAS